jgi:phage terminase large subunit-like protein
MPRVRRRVVGRRAAPSLDEDLALPAWPPDARAIAFIESLRHTKGRWAGQPFRLLPWQRERVIRPLFGTLRPDGTRQYRTCYVELGRKNGKTTLAAAIALYLLCADGEARGEVYSAAGDRDQAALAYNEAVALAGATPALASRCRIVRSGKVIEYAETGGVYRAIPADAAGSHGYNASGIILDEAHVQPNRDLYDTLVTSVGARRQPLIFIITTAGWDRQSLCWELHEYARQVAAGVIDDPTFLPILYSAAEEDDWTDPAVWRQANPSLGETVSEEFLAEECARAQQMPEYQNTFRRLYLSQWVSQETRWMPMAAWDAAGAPPAVAPGQRCWVGLDLASTTDLAALVALFRGDDGTYSVLPYLFAPEASARERGQRDRAPYERWAAEGYLELTPGNVIDYGRIAARLDALLEAYDVVEVGYDPWNATQFIQPYADAGVVCTPVRQGYQSLSEPTKRLLALVLEGKMRHGGHPVLRWMADNVVVRTDENENVRPIKPSARQRIDGIVALIIALSRALADDGAGSVYDERGVLVI